MQAAFYNLADTLTYKARDAGCEKCKLFIFKCPFSSLTASDNLHVWLEKKKSDKLPSFRDGGKEVMRHVP